MLYVGLRQQRALYAQRERSLRAETLAQEARLERLRFQLNPHFLFNALNAISTLVMDGRRDDATQMIARLADLLRATLHRPSTRTSRSRRSSPSCDAISTSSALVAAVRLPTGALINRPDFFLYVLHAADASSTVTLRVPNAWHVATSLTPTGARGVYSAPDSEITRLRQ